MAYYYQLSTTTNVITTTTAIERQLEFPTGINKVYCYCYGCYYCYQIS